MEHLENQLRFRKTLAVILVVGLVIHLALLLFLTFSGSSNPLGKSLPARIYRHQFYLGPFFSERTLKFSDHFVVGLLHDDTWNYTDVGQIYFDRYIDQPWRSHELIIGDFVRDEAINLARSKDPQYSNAFRRLLHVTGKDLPEATTSDSVRWFIIRRKYNTASRTHDPDTVFRLTFAPNEVQR